MPGTKQRSPRLEGAQNQLDNPQPTSPTSLTFSARQSIKTQLYIGASLLLALVLVLLAFNVFSIHLGVKTMRSIYESRVVPVGHLMKMESRLRELRLGMAAYLAGLKGFTHDSGHVRAIRKDIQASWEEFARAVETASHLSEEDLALIARIDAFLTRSETTLNRLELAYRTDDRLAVRAIIDNQSLAPLLAAISTFIEKQRTGVKAIYEGVQNSAQRLFGLIIIALTLAVAAIVVVTIKTVRDVVRPLAAAVEAAGRISGGDFTSAITCHERNEFGQLVRTIEHMRNQIRVRHERLQAILDHAAEGIITFDEQGTIHSFNRAAEKLLGYGEEEAIGKDLTLIIPPQGRERRPGYLEHFLRHEIARAIGHETEVSGRHKDGTQLSLALKVGRMTLSGIPMYTALVADISERKAMVEHLKTMAERDGLTGFYNRSYFQEELERVCDRNARSGSTPCALLYIDLDHFKYVNDTLGHAAGDQLLIEVAGILNKRARKSDLIARFGGDEFTILLYNAGPERAAKVAESYRERLANYNFRKGREHVDIGCSIGVAPILPGKTAEEVLAAADLACHLAKRAGRNRVHIFHADDHADVTAMSMDMGWARRIKAAIEQNKFALACQPIVHARSGEVNCYEVLIRMLDENDELVMPGGFLPAAERFGLAADIDRWVIVHAIETLAVQRLAHPKLRYSINLSAQTLATPGLVDLIRTHLEETRLPPSAITFEVTETTAISDLRVAEVFLGRLQQLGCKTALDDFGSGMSSFAYLRELPIDIVKIDGRFVKNLADSPVDQAMVKAMNDIAHALGKETIAEFVENKESFDMLGAMGVDFGQGFFLGRPDVVMPCKAIGQMAGAGDLCML